MENTIMVRIMNKTKTRSFFNIAALLITLILYLLVLILSPETAEKARKTIVIIILAITAIYDIREHKVPIFVCLAMLGINLLYAIIFEFNLISWTISFVVSAALLIIYTANKSLIGSGDIILVALCIQALLPEDVFKFLFLAFSFSSAFGLLKCFKAKKIKDISVPMSPSMAIAFTLLVI